MRKVPVRHTHKQTDELRRWLRANHPLLIINGVRQPEAASRASSVLGFPVTRAHISRLSGRLNLHWPSGGAARRPVRETPLLTVSAARTPRGKRLTHHTLESLRYIANHLLEYAAALEHIANTGRTPHEETA